MIRILIVACLIAGIVAFGLHYGRADSVFAAGFWRPPTYFAQAIAIVAVGMLAAQLGENWLYVAPGMFLALMSAGILLAVRGAHFPEFEGEIGVAVLILVLGFIVALFPRPEAWVAMILAALFGVAHGYLVGLDTPVGLRSALFFAGFLMASFALILLGVTMNDLLDRLSKAARGRALLGAVIFGVGLHMILLHYQLI